MQTALRWEVRLIKKNGTMSKKVEDYADLYCRDFADIWVAAKFR